jgi:hypothetical protein
MTRDEMQAQIDLLRQENDRLRRSVSVLVEDFVSVREEKATLREENAQLRAAIERVRALHDYPFRGDRVCIVCREEDGIPMPHPCPTLRALDGDA